MYSDIHIYMQCAIITTDKIFKTFSRDTIQEDAPKLKKNKVDALHKNETKI